MKDLYWLRHRSMQGVFGVHTLPELRAAVSAGSFPADSEVLAAAGISREAAASAPGWVPLADALHRSRPAAAAGDPVIGRQPPPAEDHRSDFLDRLRRRSAYAAVRTLIRVAMVIGIAVTCLAALIVVGATRADGMVKILALVGAAWLVSLSLIGARMLQAVLDIADCAPLRDR